MSSNNNKIDLGKVFRTNGFLLPIDESEVSEFESNLQISSELPIDWDNPLNIIKRGKEYSIQLNSSDIDQSTVNNLAMAARDGKNISEAVRKKMNEDRKKSNKQ
jgi:hypothetical protein